MLDIYGNSFSADLQKTQRNLALVVKDIRKNDKIIPNFPPDPDNGLLKLYRQFGPEPRWWPAASSGGWSRDTITTTGYPWARTTTPDLNEWMLCRMWSPNSTKKTEEPYVYMNSGVPGMAACGSKRQSVH